MLVPIDHVIFYLIVKEGKRKDKKGRERTRKDERERKREKGRERKCAWGLGGQGESDMG